MPVGIIGNADHIEWHTTRSDIVKPPSIKSVVAAISKMKHHLGCRRARFDCVVASDEELRQIVPVWWIPSVPIGPKHPGIQLVAKLNHGGWGLLLLEAATNIIRIVIDSLPELINCIVLPGSGLHLMSRIGP